MTFEEARDRYLISEETSWQGEDTTVPRLNLTVSSHRGIVAMHIDPLWAKQHRFKRVPLPRGRPHGVRRTPRAIRRTVRTAPTRGDPSRGSDEPSPLPLGVLHPDSACTFCGARSDLRPTVLAMTRAGAVVCGEVVACTRRRAAARRSL
jgi:hypothetical protein